jgi:hypothetical protein
MVMILHAFNTWFYIIDNKPKKWSVYQKDDNPKIHGKIDNTNIFVFQFFIK